MKAIWNNEIIAQAPKEELLRIEGNWYFPPSRIYKQYFEDSDHRTECPWKGEAYYYDVVVSGDRNAYGAWYYPHPKEGSFERARGDFTNYVAFWNGIEVVED